MQRFFSLFILMLPVCFGAGYGLYHSFTWGVIFGIYGAVSFAGVFRSMEIRALKRMGIKESWVDIRQEKKLEINASKVVTLERVKDVFNEMKAKVYYEDTVNGVIKAKIMCGMRWDIITAKLIENNQLTELLIESRPWLIIQIVDYGSNFQNIRTFERILTEKSQLAVVPGTR